MEIKSKEIRLQAIKAGLRRGDKKRIANQLGVHPVWVSYVIAGQGTSEPVLRAAEQIISLRKQETN